MELGKKSYYGPFYLILYISIVVSLFTQCEARSLRQPKMQFSLIRSSKKPKSMKRKLEELYSPSDPYYYIGSPFVLPPYGDMGPSSSPTINPPFCVYPPVFLPPPPSATTPTPSIPAQFSPPPPINYYSPPKVITPNPPGVTPTPPTVTPSPPGVTPTPPTVTPSPPEFVPSPPEFVPSPPSYTPGPPGFIPSPSESVPGPPEFVPSPPEFVPTPPSYTPGPPGFVPSPPGFIPSPPEFAPGPPIFLPPIVYPPPLGPPPPPATMPGLWCVAKPTVPDPIIQEAMDYACGSGADCNVIQPDGSCYQPDTLIAHASFAFNSYWQRTKVAGGTCDFGGTAMLVTKDPSFDGCHFNLL